MKIKIDNQLVTVIANTVLLLIGISILFFTSIIWLGTKEVFENLVNNFYWSFWGSRFLFNLFVELVIIALIGSINWLIQRITKLEIRIKRILLIDSLILTICSVLFIIISLTL